MNRLHHCVAPSQCDNVLAGLNNAFFLSFSVAKLSTYEWEWDIRIIYLSPLEKNIEVVVRS